MKIVCSSWLTRRRPEGFTLAEIMIVVVIFSVLILVLISSQLFGLRMHRVSETKLAATADGRRVLNHIREEARQGKLLYIGNLSGTNFTRIQDSKPQIGNALEIHPTTNRAVYTRYYVDVTDRRLMSISSEGGPPQVIANFVTNQFAFQAEDFRGNILTNDNNNRVIRMTLEFYQWEYPIATIGNGGLYDYYRLQTRITRRLIE
jgi:prepilin-type N-terminal cleavage/methylation domain-containing protein